jgi:hypothetical protein
MKGLPPDDQFRRKAGEATRILLGKPPKTESRKTGEP